ncbi:deleted in malignant brain tumors 1 protein-like [Lytechinus variegatus]|uniref:deleted in malignant brain tumors 1 protein-like n=1 Tax=Lytechinus variegatus TaxID=7654 RepID=UPI001BB1BF35|nr:deleted in malignant brain tumors 1 protein-like [Lytechinus variegatus]
MSAAHIKMQYTFIVILLGACTLSLFAGAQNSTTSDHDAVPWSVRLVGGIYESEGRVEVFHDSQWVTICDSLWSIEDATVVCRQLNYSGADLALVAGLFGGGQGAVGLTNMECNGMESNLSTCKFDLVEDTWCGHSRDAGVVCTSQGSLRLANGTVPGEGRVEILGGSGEWGTICDDLWDKIDAGVACRQLGYPDAVDVYVNRNYPHSQPYFGPGTGPILLDGLACTSDKRHLRDCSVTKGWGIHDCVHGEDAGMECDTKLTRLVDGDYDDEGRIEVYYGGRWGRICPTEWSIEDAHVVCRELGYPLGARKTKLFDGGDGPFLMDDMQCEGNETRLTDCIFPGFANVHNCAEDYTQGAGVICNKPSAVVKLLSGSGSFEGVVEYRFESEPGLICDSDWSDIEADILCRQLGYQHGSNEKPVSLGPLSGTIHYHDYHCIGTEDQIGDCTFTVVPRADRCNSDHIAQVVCGPPIDFDLRMTGSRFSEQGRLEVFLQGEWGYVAAGYFSRASQDTACRHLGFAGALYDTYDEFDFARSSRPILIDDILCSDSDMKITDCYRLKLSGPNSTRQQSDEASVLCFPYESVANHPMRFRDENGVVNRNYGVIEIYHDGVWGPICDSSFYQYEILCRQLGHKDISQGGTLMNYDGKYTSDGPIWFRLSYCPSYSSSYGVEHDKIYECRHGPWGYSGDCSRDYLATARCVYVDQSLDYDTTPDVSYSRSLSGWEVLLIAIAVVVPTCCIIGCCYHSRRTPTNATTTGASAAYTAAATNDTHDDHVDGVCAESQNPSPPYEPPSPTPEESPPTYDSVATPMMGQNGNNPNAES